MLILPVLGSHDIFERLAKADPSNADWQRDLSVVHSKIGGVQQAQGDLAAALTSYQASLAIAERLTKADPSNAGDRDHKQSGKGGSDDGNYCRIDALNLAPHVQGGARAYQCHAWLRVEPTWPSADGTGERRPRPAAIPGPRAGKQPR
jgi:hypothetical protein